MTTRALALSEVVVAVLVLSTLSVVLVGVVPSTMAAMKTAENRTQAASFAREVIEKIERHELDTLVSGPVRSSNGTDFHSNGTDFQMRMDVSQVTDPDGNPLDQKRIRLVDVSVKWTESNNKLQSYTASTVLRRQ